MTSLPILKSQLKLVNELKNKIDENNKIFISHKKDLKKQIDSINNSTEKKICKNYEDLKKKINLYTSEIEDLKQQINQNDNEPQYQSPSPSQTSKESSRSLGNYNNQREPTSEEKALLKNAFPEKSQFIRKDNLMMDPTLVEWRRKNRVFGGRKTKKGGYIYSSTRKNKVVSSTSPSKFIKRGFNKRATSRRRRSSSSKFGGTRRKR
jgi:hypothetical protein